MNLKYYTRLDGLRGIAALMVVIYHIFYYPNLSYLPNHQLFLNIAEYGRHGVPLFFVLSGFVITRILVNTRENSDYFKSFYKRRILRILPLYYLFLFIYYAFAPLLKNDQEIGFIFHVPFYLYFQNLTELLNIKASGPGHYWTLAIEEHFYLFWPLAMYFVKPKHLGITVILVIPLVLLARYFMLMNDLPTDKFTFTRIDQLLLGAYLAFLEWKQFFTKKNSCNNFIILSIVTIISIIAVHKLANTFPLLPDLANHLLIGLLFFSSVGFILTLKNSHFISLTLETTVMQFLGRISYGIYVWHILVILILNRFFITKILLLDFFLTIGLSILVAYISYNFFEIVFLKMKDQKISLLNIKNLIKFNVFTNK